MVDLMTAVDAPTTRAASPRTETTPERRRAHAPVPESVDVAVVGAGMGGLVAAAELARRGLSVACFDGHYVAGGCATQFSRGPKRARYRFDVGLHYVGDCRDGEIPRILRGLGAPVEFAELDPDGFDTLVFPDLTFRIPADVDRYRDRLVAVFPHERRGIDRYVTALRAVMNLGRRMDRNEGSISLRIVAASLRETITMARIGDRTMGALLDGWIRDPKLKAVLLGQSGDYGLPPSRVSAVLHLGLAAHYFRGAFYPKGGGQVIADQIALAIERAGGTVHLRRPVSRVVVEGGRAVGVELAPRAGEPARRVRARVVVSNADLTRTLLELVGPEHLPSSWVTRARGFESTAALFMTFLGVTGDMAARGMSNTNIWQFDEYDLDRFYRDSMKLEIRGCYITSASFKDPDNAREHAPAGITNVEVMTLVPGTGAAWGVDDRAADAWSYGSDAAYLEKKQRIEDDMIARLDGLFPGSAAAVVHRESATPVTHRRFTGAAAGTPYGLAATPEQFLKNRPGYRGPLPGLFFCGASTRAGHGIVGAMSSGRRAAFRVAQELGSGAVDRARR